MTLNGNKWIQEIFKWPQAIKIRFNKECFEIYIYDYSIYS